MDKNFYRKHNSFSSFEGKDVDITKSTLSRIMKVKDNKLGLSNLSLSHQQYPTQP